MGGQKSSFILYSGNGTQGGLYKASNERYTISEATAIIQCKGYGENYVRLSAYLWSTDSLFDTSPRYFCGLPKHQDNLVDKFDHLLIFGRENFPLFWHPELQHCSLL